MHARSFCMGCSYQPGHARPRWSTATSASTSTAAMSAFTSRPSNTGRWRAGQQRHLAGLTPERHQGIHHRLQQESSLLRGRAAHRRPGHPAQGTTVHARRAGRRQTSFRPPG